MEVLCPFCGRPMEEVEVDTYLCEPCGQKGKNAIVYLEEPDDETEDAISVYDAALIWMSSGKDEDYTFGYSEEELEDALN